MLKKNLFLVLFLSSFLLFLGFKQQNQIILNIKKNNSSITILEKNIIYGEIPLYNIVNNKKINELSGAATNGQFTLIVDDSGQPGHFFLPDINMSSKFTKFNFSKPHNDLEGATWLNDYFIVTTSMSKKGDQNKSFRLLTRFKKKNLTDNIHDELSVDLRSSLLKAIKENFKDNKWYNRIIHSAPKNGGLNIEAVSKDNFEKNSILLGLRSPLYGKKFAQNLQSSMKNLHSGRAIIVRIKNPFNKNLKYSFITIDIMGHGIRGMEYIPALNGYVIIGGPVFKGTGFSLWLLDNKNKLYKFIVPGFDKLCRPESVISFISNKKNYLMIFSEDSGKMCKTAPYNYICAEICWNNIINSY